MKDRERRDRDGRGYRWRYMSSSKFTVSEVSGYTVDNLDSKKLPEANGRFEKIFIHIRDTLDAYDGDFSNKYDVCHHIARYLTQNFDNI